MIALRIKSALVGSPLETASQIARRFVGITKWWAHPELAEVYLEDKRLPLVLGRLIKSDSNIVDVGCHIGSFLSLAQHISHNGSHIAIEASPTKAAWLKQKFPKVRTEQVAISDHIGAAVFEENIRNPGFSKLEGDHPTKDRVNRYEVAVTTLDALNLGSNITLIKIDIEGAELAALKGGKRFFAANRPYLIFECGADANAGLDRRSLFEFLTGCLGYSVFTFADFLHNKGPLSFDEFRKCGVYPFRAFNFIAAKSNP